MLITFLYTHCPDVCPLTAENLNQALRSIGQQRQNVRVLAISVDPKGDTPSAVTHFVQIHRLLPQFHYLTGPRSTLHAIWAAYGVKSRAQAGDNRVDHTLYTLMLDRSQKARVLDDATATPTTITHDLRILLKLR